MQLAVVRVHHFLLAVIRVNFLYTPESKIAIIFYTIKPCWKHFLYFIFSISYGFAKFLNILCSVTFPNLQNSDELGKQIFGFFIFIFLIFKAFVSSLLEYIITINLILILSNSHLRKSAFSITLTKQREKVKGTVPYCPLYIRILRQTSNYSTAIKLNAFVKHIL